MSRLTRMGLVAWALAACPVAYGEVVVNPLTGNEESVESRPTANGREIVWSVNDGGWQPSVALTSNLVDDLDPVLCFSPNGRRFVFFWRDEATDSVVVLRDSADAVWGDEEPVYVGSPIETPPSCAFFASEAHFAFSVQAGPGLRHVLVGDAPDDDPECPGEGCPEEPPCPGEDCPINLYQLYSVQVMFQIDLILHSESNHLWTTWVDTDGEIGFAEHDAGLEAWGPLDWMPISVDVETTRAQIAALILDQ